MFGTPQGLAPDSWNCMSSFKQEYMCQGSHNISQNAVPNTHKVRHSLKSISGEREMAGVKSSMDVV